MDLYGRDVEFAELRGLWQAVAAGQGPRAIAYVADTGVGKSRLVQELYHHLSRAADPFDYWPDAFLDAGASLQVTPPFPAGHRPAGPPMFLWLGVRWTDPGERNAVDVRALPDLRDQLVIHARLARDLQDPWLRRLIEAAGEVLTERAAGELQNLLLDQLVPFGALALGTAREITARATRGALSVAGHDAAQEQELQEQLRTLLRKLLGGTRRLPVVLWLDDAHWIDERGMAFVGGLRRDAKAGGWPLLLIATAWPREWHERHLAALLGDGGTVRDLDQASAAALDALSRRELPGLSDAQRALLVAKADGNFLTLLENIDELRMVDENFVDGDLRRALSPAGEGKLQGWESSRPRRIAQRFQAFDREVRAFLARASALGLSGRIIVAVVRAYAAQRQLPDVDALLRRCRDEYAVLLARSAQLYEFRDPGYHRAALAFFTTYLAAEQQALAAALDGELAGWIGRSFDAAGVRQDAAAPDDSVLRLAAGERSALLALARDRLGVTHTAGMQARVLWLQQLAEDRQWDLVRDAAAELAAADWAGLPATALAWRERDVLVELLRNAGALVPAAHLAGHLVVVRRQHLAAAPTDDARAALGEALNRIGYIHELSGNLDAAQMCLKETVQQYQAIMARPFTTDERFVVGFALNLSGRIYHRLGNRAAARTQFEDSLKLLRTVQEDRGTDEDQRVLGLALNWMGRIHEEQNDLAGALQYFQEAVTLAERVADLRGFPSDWLGLAVMHQRVGRIHRRQ
ncbi:MAG: AAA family ATPase, partial [Chloroflexi bacterium]|nr:AAA family ATPase [Chloroflexota bacterium]